jgi:hypothetical protein
MQTYRIRLGQFDQRNAAGGYAGEVAAIQSSAITVDAMT